MTEVSNPPEYPRTTLSAIGVASLRRCRYKTKKCGPGVEPALPAKALVTANRLNTTPAPDNFHK